MKEENIHLQTKNGIGLLLIRRPQQLNALNIETIEELHQRLNVLEKDNNLKVKKVKNTKFEFIIKFADLFFEESAITLKKRLEDEYNLKDINIKKMSKNLYRVYKGPFYNLGSIKNVYNEIADINFENIELIKL